MSTALAQPAGAAPRPVASAADAAQLIKHLADVMDALLGIVEEETELVRAGKLAAAQKLEPDKAELSRMYLLDTARIKSSQVYLEKAMPAAISELRERHETFRALLQINLTVLATAHAVSESIMRSVSTELARKATPQAYGASGKATAPPASSMQPLTLSRVL